MTNEENKEEFMDSEGLQWINHYGWTNIDEKWPPSDTEVVVLYISSSDEGTSSYTAEVINEKFIDLINTPVMYWILKPE